MKEKICQLREHLNEQISLKKYDAKKVLKLSQELDKLIVQYYREEDKVKVIRN